MAKRKRRSRTMFGAVSKGDFVAIADILCTEGASQPLVQRFSHYFGSQNPRFNIKRFEAAATSCRR